MIPYLSMIGITPYYEIHQQDVQLSLPNKNPVHESLFLFKKGPILLIPENHHSLPVKNTQVSIPVSAGTWLPSKAGR
jgi:hypothetical protein